MWQALINAVSSEKQDMEAGAEEVSATDLGRGPARGQLSCLPCSTPVFP